MAYNYQVQAGEQQIISGGTTVVGVTLLSGGRYSEGGGIQIVESGGTAYNTRINPFAEQIVSKGGVAYNTTVAKGDSYYYPVGETVSAGGKSISALVMSYGIQAVYGVASNTQIIDSGIQIVYGKSLKPTVNMGILEVYSGGLAKNIKYTNNEENNSCEIIVYSGGYAENINLSCRVCEIGDIIIAEDLEVIGGTVKNTSGVKADIRVRTSSGSLDSTKGSAINTTLTSGTLGVNRGEITSTVLKNSYLTTYSATLKKTTISGGSSYIDANSTAAGTKLFSGAKEEVYGIAQKTTIYKGAHQHIFGKSFDVVVTASGSAVVETGGEILHAIIKKGGTLELKDQAIITDVILDPDAKLVTSGSVRKTNVVVNKHITEGVWTGETQNIASGSLKKNVGIFGTQNILAGGSAYQTSVNNGGVQNVYGALTDTTITKGGTVNAYKGAKISSVTLSGKGTLNLESGVALGGTTTVHNGAIVAGSKKNFTKLSPNATLVLDKNVSLSKFYANLSSANLRLTNVNNSIAAVKMDKKTNVFYDIKDISPVSSKYMLNVITKNSQKVGNFTIETKKAQDIGTYHLSHNLVQSKGKKYTVAMGKTEVGTVSVNKGSLTAGGVTYSLQYSENGLSLRIAMKAGAMKKGNGKANSLTGTGNSDIFFGGKGNDKIAGIGGRDVAVYDTTDWGEDTIAKTSGTITLLFKDLAAKDITQKLNAEKGVMTITRADDAEQKITISGWNDDTHNIVFGGTMKDFTTYLKAASPTSQQKAAARKDVWKKAGLASA
ncbi:MAG: hypothetical protein IJU76_02650 [Desulfovibrionaceae bacterium]|nr:hypothetical protein [Desulfovibrionaceae bacterium]